MSINSVHKNTVRHLDELPNEWNRPFREVVSYGKRPRTVRATIEYLESNEKTQSDIIAEYGVTGETIRKTVVELAEVNGIEAEDQSLFIHTLHVDYSLTRQLVCNLDMIPLDGKSPIYKIALWFANNMKRESINALYQEYTDERPL